MPMACNPPAVPNPPPDASPGFAALVDDLYAMLHRFALGLARDEREAADLTQQTFYVWACKGHQLRDASKAKAWLFTTLRREFLRLRGRQMRFPQVEFNEWAEDGALAVDAGVVNALDGAAVLRAVQEVPEVYRAPLLLFYVEDFSYAEIAAALRVRPGTVMSRLSRGRAELRARLAVAPVGVRSPRPPPAATLASA